MARCKWHGTPFTATPIRKLPNGNWLMRAEENGPRFAKGSEIEIDPKEIVEMAAAETPPEEGVAS